MHSLPTLLLTGELFLFQERHCHFQQGIYNAWKEGQPGVIEQMRRDCLTVVNPLGSKKGPHVHLSLLRVISVLPPPTCFWSGVVLTLGSAGAIQTCPFWGERNPVWLDKGALCLPLCTGPWTWCHVKMAKEFPGNVETAIVHIISWAYLLTWVNVRYLQMFLSKEVVRSSSNCKRDIYGLQIYF